MGVPSLSRTELGTDQHQLVLLFFFNFFYISKLILDMVFYIHHKGSLHKKKTEICWSFTNGGDTPRPIYFRVFPEEKFYCLKMIYMLRNM